MFYIMFSSKQWTRTVRAPLSGPPTECSRSLLYHKTSIARYIERSFIINYYCITHFADLPRSSDEREDRADLGSGTAAAGITITFVAFYPGYQLVICDSYFMNKISNDI